MPRKYFTCGIYTITTPNNSVYVGSSNKIERRFSEHRSMLKYGKHHSVRLQSAFDKHGSNLKFEIVCQCNAKDLNKKEQEYINKLGAKLNTTKFVNNVWTNEKTRKKLTKIHQSKEWKEARSKIAKNISKRWRKVKCSNGKIYKNLTEAANEFGVRASGIACLVKTHQIGKLGVKFRYANEKWKPEIIPKQQALITRTKNGNLKHTKKTKAKLKKAKIGYKPSYKAINASIKANKIPITGVSLKDGHIVMYNSTKEAAIKHHNLSIKTAQSQICKNIYGSKKSAYGYKWTKNIKKEK